MALQPITRAEQIMSGESLIPITREEMFLAKAAGQDVQTPTPITRREMFLSKIAEGGGSGGGGIASVSEKDINFYDYDGTCLYAYTVEEAQALSELPALPEREGLICQGWNWSLENIKAHNRAVNVGATYTTDDGTTRLYITLHEGRTSPMLGVCPNGTVTVDWGDGIEPDVLTGTSTSTVVRTPTHEYAAPGDYVIRLTVDGTMGIQGSSGKSYILRYSSATDNRDKAYLNSLQKCEIGDSITSIGDNAFSSCYSLANITIPNGVTRIGSNAFYQCYSLASVTIPNGVTSIGDNAFYYCHSLASVTIPNGVTRIGDNTFSSCYSLANITIPNGVTRIGSNAFYQCYSLASVTIPVGVGLSTSAFAFCYSLASVTIPAGVSLGREVFKECHSLASVTILYGVTSISSLAFYNCYSLAFCDFTKCTAVPSLPATSVFNSIPADCEIRIPAALYDEWIAATNWSTYASQIVAV